MPTHHGGVQVMLGDGSVRMLHRARPVTLAAIAQGLRRAAHSASVTVWGTPVPALQAVMSGLRQLGVAMGAPTVRPAADPLPVLMVIADFRDVVHGQGAAVLFVVADDDLPTPLLLPAVQAAREAARRATRDGEVELVLVQRAQGASAQGGTDMLALNFQKIRMD
jgi:hypothetical protein